MTNHYNNDPENENFLFGKNKELPFIVPDGYFESLAAQLAGKIEVMEEIKELNALSAVPKKLSYTVPENYFALNENLLESKCELSDLPMLSSIPKKTLKPHADEVLADDIHIQVEIAEELRTFQVLSSLKKENKFEVSPDYFGNSAEVIKTAVHEVVAERSAKVVQGFFRPKILMACAAAIVITVCAVFYFNSTKQEMISGDCHTLACLEKNEILNDNTIRDLGDESLYDMVDVEQLDKQLSGEEPSDSPNVNDSNKVH